jgi:hypothetical protein
MAPSRRLSGLRAVQPDILVLFSHSHGKAGCAYFHASSVAQQDYVARNSLLISALDDIDLAKLLQF